MTRHIIEREAPKAGHIPVNIPPQKKYHTILADPPWTKNQCSRDGSYGSAINHYSLMALERIKAMPVESLVADDAHCYIWAMNGNIDEALEVMKAWGFRYITKIDWIKPKMGVGNYWRNASETCLFGVRGKLPPKSRTQINWFIDYPTDTHSEKSRMFISMLERVSPGPYLELFCRKRPASREPWDCWGDQTEGGADLYIPGYPVPKYSFEHTGTGENGVESPTDATSEDGKEVQ